MTSVAVKYLARPESSTVGIIGAGVQSRTHLMMLNEVLPNIEVARLYNRTPSHSVALKSEMEERLGIHIKIVDSAEAAVRDSDIVLTATTTHDPIVRGDWLGPGMLSIQLAGHECTFDVISRADKIVCDDWEGVKHRAIMTPAKMYEAGLLKDEDIHANLGAVVNGRKTGREHSEEHIHFAAMGMGVSDVAMAALVYERAMAADLGKRLPLWDHPLWV